jgi:hypothetical protein
MEILIGLGIAITISLTIYLGKLQKEEEFQPFKLARTLAVGIVLGIIAYVKGYTITAENYEAYLLANAGIIGGVDVVVKVAYRFIAGLIKK